MWFAPLLFTGSRSELIVPRKMALDLHPDKVSPFSDGNLVVMGMETPVAQSAAFRQRSQGSPRYRRGRLAEPVGDQHWVVLDRCKLSSLVGGINHADPRVFDSVPTIVPLLLPGACVASRH